MQVGAFGLPTGDARVFKTDSAVAPDGTNFNSLTEPGTYRLLLDMSKSTSGPISSWYGYVQNYVRIQHIPRILVRHIDARVRGHNKSLKIGTIAPFRIRQIRFRLYPHREEVVLPSGCLDQVSEPR